MAFHCTCDHCTTQHPLCRRDMPTAQAPVSLPQQPPLPLVLRGPLDRRAQAQAPLLLPQRRWLHSLVAAAVAPARAEGSRALSGRRPPPPPPRALVPGALRWPGGRSALQRWRYLPRSSSCLPPSSCSRRRRLPRPPAEALRSRRRQRPQQGGHLGPHPPVLHSATRQPSPLRQPPPPSTATHLMMSGRRRKARA